MTVSQLLANISSAELTEWIAYASIEPIGDMRGDVQSAIVASTFGNAFSKSELSPEDFIIDFWQHDRSKERRHPNAIAFEREYARLMGKE